MPLDATKIAAVADRVTKLSARADAVAARADAVSASGSRYVHHSHMTDFHNDMAERHQEMGADMEPGAHMRAAQLHRIAENAHHKAGHYGADKDVNGAPKKEELHAAAMANAITRSHEANEFTKKVHAKQDKAYGES